MQNGLSKANTVELVQALDLVGITMCLAQDRREPLPLEVESALITMLGEIRQRLANSYGLVICPSSSVFGNPVRDNCSPADVADEILRDLDNDDPFNQNGL